MPFKQFSDDEVLTFDVVNRYFVQQHSVIKPSDETVTSSATLQNDDHLFVPLLANSQYFIEFMLIYDTINTADLQVRFTGPVGCSMDWTHGGLGTSAASSVGSISRNYRNISNIGTIGGPAAALGTVCVAPGEGRVVTTGTAGTLNLQWAQNASIATGTTIKAKSVLIAQRLTV